MIITDFKLERFSGQIFSGFTNNEEWNIWACPYFTFDEAQRIAALQNELPGSSAQYDQAKDAFIF